MVMYQSLIYHPSYCLAQVIILLGPLFMIQGKYTIPKPVFSTVPVVYMPALHGHLA